MGRDFESRSLDGKLINDRITDAVVEGVARDLGFDVGRLAADQREPYRAPEPVDWCVGFDPDAPLVRGGQGRADLDVPQAMTVWTVLGWAFIAAVSFGAGYLLGMGAR